MSEQSSSETVSEPIIKTGGDSSISDSELETFDNISETPRQTVKPVEKTEKLDTKKEVELIADAIEDEVIENIEPESKEKLPATDKKTKTYKLKNGDVNVALRDDTIVPLKVNDKLEEITFKELVANYSGKVDYTRKYGEFYNERKAFHTERDTIQGRVDQFYTMAVKDKNPRQAIEYLAEAMGADPGETWNNLVNPIKEMILSLKDLSPEQIAAREKDEELDYLRRKEQGRRDDTLKTREKTETIEQIKATQTEFQMTPEQFKTCYEDLYSEAKKTGFDVEKLTPKMVGDYFQIIDRKSKVKEITESVSKDSQTRTKISQELYDVWTKHPEMKLDDIRDIAARAYGDKGPSKLAKRVVRDKKEQTKTPQIEPISWDDL